MNITINNKAVEFDCVETAIALALELNFRGFRDEARLVKASFATMNAIYDDDLVQEYRKYYEYILLDYNHSRIDIEACQECVYIEPSDCVQCDLNYECNSKAHQTYLVQELTPCDACPITDSDSAECGGCNHNPHQ